MIFPSSGQNVHNVQIAFPGTGTSEKSGSQSGPKFVRSDTNTRIPVVAVEKTSNGSKIKFVHHGIRMVMYEDSKLTKAEVKMLYFVLLVYQLKGYIRSNFTCYSGDQESRSCEHAL